LGERWAAAGALCYRLRRMSLTSSLSLLRPPAPDPGGLAPAAGPRRRWLRWLAAVAAGGAALLAVAAPPVYRRFEVRVRSREVVREVRRLAAAERRRRAEGKPYLALAHPVPSGPLARGERVRWSIEDLALAAELGWRVDGATAARYAVAVAGEEGGPQALAVCGEIDADGDGRVAAIVLFEPALGARGELRVAPPAAPCSADPVVAPGKSLVWSASLRAGEPLRISPSDVR